MEGDKTAYFSIFDDTCVKHDGIVSKISNHSITVALTGSVHCEACNAKMVCGASESNSKEIEVEDVSQALRLNENVEVILKKNVGLKAVFWAYVFPFILLMVTLLVSSLYYKEWVAGLLAFAILVPYYGMLYVLRSTLKKEFQISLIKTHQ